MSSHTTPPASLSATPSSSSSVVVMVVRVVVIGYKFTEYRVTVETTHMLLVWNCALWNPRDLKIKTCSEHEKEEVKGRRKWKEEMKRGSGLPEVSHAPSATTQYNTSLAVSTKAFFQFTTQGYTSPSFLSSKALSSLPWSGQRRASWHHTPCISLSYKTHQYCH